MVHQLLSQPSFHYLSLLRRRLQAITYSLTYWQLSFTLPAINACNNLLLALLPFRRISTNNVLTMKCPNLPGSACPIAPAHTRFLAQSWPRTGAGWSPQQPACFWEETSAPKLDAGEMERPWLLWCACFALSRWYLYPITSPKWSLKEPEIPDLHWGRKGPPPYSP